MQNMDELFFLVIKLISIFLLRELNKVHFLK